MKKAFGQKIWLTILISIVAGLMVFGFYNFITNIKKKQTDVVVLEFFQKLENEVKTNTNNYGSVSYKEYNLGNVYTTVCFSEYGKASSAGISNPEIVDIIDEGVKKNVFVYNQNDFNSYYVPGIVIENLSDTKFGCYNLTDGLLRLRFEARGYGTLIGPPSINISYGDCIIKIPDLMKTGRLRPDLWKLDQRYFKNDSGKIIQICGYGGWENITVIK